MKHLFFFTALACALTAHAAQPHDSIPAQMLEEVTVVATRAGDKTPVAFSNITKQQLQAINHGKDMPAILNMMPSVTTSSDAGTGIGYTGIHVRGTDPTRRPSPSSTPCASAWGPRPGPRSPSTTSSTSA